MPLIARASTVGLILPRDCAFSSDAKDKISLYLKASGIKDADVLMQRPGSDKVSRLNSMRKFLAFGVDIIVVWGGTSLKEIAVEAGKTPIVFVGVWDPVASGIVKSLDQPGQNITGVVGRTSAAFLVDNIIESTGIKVLGLLYHSGIVDSKAQYEDEKATAPGKGLDILEVDLQVTPQEEAPAALEQYVQEAGRGGRDGKKANAILLFDAEELGLVGSFAYVDDMDRGSEPLCSLNIDMVGWDLDLWPGVLMLGLVAFFHMLMRRTALGRHILAVGGNESAAFHAGVAVGRVKAFAYVAAGGLSSLGGVVLAVVLGQGKADLATGYELDVIAAAVVGGGAAPGDHLS